MVFVSAPFVLRYEDVAYVDVPACAMMLALGSAAYRAYSHFGRYATAIAVIGGSFGWIKLELLPTALLVIVLIVWFAKVNGAGRKRVLLLVAAFSIVACPWFLLNFVEAGDPISPLLNLTFHHRDPFWIQADLDGQNAGMRSNVPFPIRPIAMFLNPTDAADWVDLAFCFNMSR